MEAYVCRLCGGRFGWEALRQHEATGACRPTKVELPQFELDETAIPQRRFNPELFGAPRAAAESGYDDAESRYGVAAVPPRGPPAPSPTTVLPLTEESLRLIREAETPEGKLRSALGSSAASPSEHHRVVSAERPNPFSFAALAKRIQPTTPTSTTPDQPQNRDVCKKIFQTYFSGGAAPAGAPPPMSAPARGRQMSPQRMLSPRAASPGSQCCRHCGQRFGDYQLAQRMLHQRVCPKNPLARQQCVYCSLEFVSTYEKLATELVADHEEVCLRNPKNICPYCGQSFGGMGGQTAEVSLALEKHKNVCILRPDNSSECRFCGQTYCSTLSTSAGALLEQHLVTCIENPRNSCRFCRQKFTGKAFPPEATPVAQRRRHEMVCPVRLMNKQMYSFQYRPAAARSGAQFRSSASLPPASSRSLVSTGDAQARRIIEDIRRQYKGLPRDKQRAFLRKQQLEWHPDRVALKHPAEEHLAGCVFQFVQKLWSQHTGAG